ncbi:hypothetical protein F183_A51500 [Bryobacterales bacterium F-183]|nr:hypothetical protein F183_A51500 [Bryobacterales bacterium F-183]
MKALLKTLIFTFATAMLCHADPVLHMVASAPSVDVGQTVFLDVSISGMFANTAPSLKIYQMEVWYNDTVFDVTGHSVGTQLQLNGNNSSWFRVSKPGYVIVREHSDNTEQELNDLQADSFHLFRLTLTGIKPGFSSFYLANVSLLDPRSPEPQPIAASFAAARASIAVNAVPEPSAAGVLLGSLGIAAKLLRRKRHA